MNSWITRVIAFIYLLFLYFLYDSDWQMHVRDPQHWLLDLAESNRKRRDAPFFSCPTPVLSVGTCCLPSRIAMQWCNGMLWIAAITGTRSKYSQARFIFNIHRCYSDTPPAYKYMESCYIGHEHPSPAQRVTPLPDLAAFKTWSL